MVARSRAKWTWGVLGALLAVSALPALATAASARVATWERGADHADPVAGTTAMRRVRGHVTRASDGSRVADVTVGFVDRVTGASAPSVQTGASGRFLVQLPVGGIYDVLFDPHEASGLAPLALREVSVDGSLRVRLGAITLSPAVTITGKFTGPQGVGGALDAKIGVFDAGSGRPLYTASAPTLGDGRFEARVVPGTYDLEVYPTVVSVLAPWRVSGIDATSSIDIGSWPLQVGVTASGTVTDVFASPVFGARVELWTPSGPIATVDNATDETGRYEFHVAPGTYEARFVPALNSLLVPTIRPGVTVDGSADLTPAFLEYANSDNDQRIDVFDNCPLTSNGSQEDFDGDGVGSQCDNCPLSNNPRQENNDGSGGGDACDSDDDNDNTPDFADVDRDGDGVNNVFDNCPNAWNPDQRDFDGDGTADACDDDDGEIEHLAVLDQQTVLWRVESGAMFYRLYRVPLHRLSKINFGTCVFETVIYDASVTRPFYVEAQDPSHGEGFGYLATAVTATGEGSLGVGIDGNPRPNLRPCH